MYHSYRRSLFTLRRLVWRVIVVAQRFSWRFRRTLALTERRRELARREHVANTPLAPHVLSAAREREEERLFKETIRAHSVPTPLRRAGPQQLGQVGQLDHIRHTAAQLKTPLTTNAGLPICVLKTPPSFTASVMARVSATAASAPSATPSTQSAPSDAPPASEAPAAQTRFPSAPPGLAMIPGAETAPRISTETLWRHVFALFGVYGLSAAIVLCSGWLFAVLAPGLVFALLSATVSAVIMALATFGALWRTANGAIGGVGMAYVLLLLLLAPILLVASQAPRVLASGRHEA